MADISNITLPSGTTYNLKDAQAREDIAILQSTVTGGMHYIGVTTTAISDGSSTNPIKVGSADVTAKSGDIVMYGELEFVWSSSDSKWHEFGSTGSLKSLAFKDSASGSYTPAGTVSQPTFTGSSSSVDITAQDDSGGNYQPKGTVSAPTISKKTSGSTTVIKNPTSKTVMTSMTAAAPGQSAPANPITYYSVSDETLSLYQIGYQTGASISTANVTVKNGDAEYEASAPTFTGTKTQLSGTTTAKGSVSKPSFTGTSKTVTVS